MSQPQRLVVVNDDGSTKEAAFADLDGRSVLMLAQLGLCPPPDHVGAAKHYLLVRWQDGWLETFAIDSESADLVRYFVIERIENRGRLSIDVGAEYPELFIVERTPEKVAEAMIVSDEDIKAYGLGSQVERWEGIFEDGGKKEYVKYDRTSDSYPHESGATCETFATLTARLRAELEERQLTPGAVLSLEEPLRIAEYKGLAGTLGIRGGRRQQDVYGLIEMLLRRQGGREA